jgi:non-heme chloroperoxidase
VLLEELDLRDVTLVGHSMGTGEVTRYLGSYGSERIARGVLVSPIPPFLLQADDNPEGLPGTLFDEFVKQATADGPAWMKGFLDNFYNIDVFGGNRVSDQAFQASFNVASAASAAGTVACIPTWETDFRQDVAKIDVPMLVVQGDADRILPFEKTGKRLPGLIKDMKLVVIAGGPHAIAWTHAFWASCSSADQPRDAPARRRAVPGSWRGGRRPGRRPASGRRAWSVRRSESRVA